MVPYSVHQGLSKEDVWDNFGLHVRQPKNLIELEARSQQL